MGKGRTKNLRFGDYGEMERSSQLGDASRILSAFNNEDLPIDDLEDVYSLDMDIISQESNTLAAGTVNNLLRLYNNKEFTEEHPEFRKRIDTEIESLRKYYKMAKTDEQVHDHLALAISNNPNNASLYTSLSRLQATMMQVDSKIREIISEFNKICTSFQTEINFQLNNQEVDGTHEDKDGAVTSRGSKAFIEEMNKEPENLFEEEDDEESEEDVMELS